MPLKINSESGMKIDFRMHHGHNARSPFQSLSNISNARNYPQSSIKIEHQNDVNKNVRKSEIGVEAH